jgi:hypothetical protein
MVMAGIYPEPVFPHLSSQVNNSSRKPSLFLHGVACTFPARKFHMYVISLDKAGLFTQFDIDK